MKSIYADGPNRKARRQSRFKAEYQARLDGDGRALAKAILARMFNAQYDAVNSEPFLWANK